MPESPAPAPRFCLARDAKSFYSLVPLMRSWILAHRLKGALLILAGILCVSFGLSLRLDSLEKRPVHADEATGARILAERIETGSYSFDPLHFHGPLLTAVAAPVARLRGETDWESLSRRTLRLPIAWIGALTIVLALAFFPWLGGGGGLAAAALVATSPFLVYYSRVFIHETLFAFLALGTVLALFLYLETPARWKAVAVGVAGGLLMATRETFVICAFAWVVAGAILVFERYLRGGRPIGGLVLGPVIVDALTAAGVALLIAAAFYTDAGSNPSGMVDLFRTFFAYETGEGHDKPFVYYTWLLLWPKFQGGVWWTEAGIGVAAAAGFGLSFRHDRGAWIRFLLYAAIIQWIVYSWISYKTPWLVLTAWLHLCLVAGAGFFYLLGCRRTWSRIALVAVLVFVLWWQIGQSGRAAHRYASDARNPYAYVPTSPDIERLRPFLVDLAGLFPEMKAGPIGVIGRGYWPLPWYLRGLAPVGYWPALPEDGHEFPALLILPAELATVRERLDGTHAVLPRGLRADVRVYLLVRNDIWEAYLNLEDE